MSEIEIDIQDTNGHVVTLKVPPTTLLEEVAILARDELQLPLHNLQGQGLRYALFHSRLGRFLTLDLTVFGQRLQVGDRVRILPCAIGTLFELELQTEPNPGMPYPIPNKDTSIGRDFSNEIVIRHKAVSRQHGLLTWQDGFHLYLDMGSANGSLINNQPVNELTPIAVGDILTLGQNVRLLYRERIKVDPALAFADENLSEAKDEQSRTGLVEIPRTQVYLSYSEGQRETAEVLIENLGKTGVKVYYDAQEPLSLMQRSGVMILILSREAVASEKLQDEWREFYSLRKPMIAILFEACRIPDVVDDVAHFIDYQYDDRALAGDVLEELHRIKPR
jgi:FHA domain/TIR domain